MGKFDAASCGGIREYVNGDKSKSPVESQGRAGQDAHSKNAKTRKEAMEVLALVPRKKPKGK